MTAAAEAKTFNNIYRTNKSQNSFIVIYCFYFNKKAE